MRLDGCHVMHKIHFIAKMISSIFTKSQHVKVVLVKLCWVNLHASSIYIIIQSWNIQMIILEMNKLHIDTLKGMYDTHLYFNLKIDLHKNSQKNIN